jgi:ABC-type thiamine transport system ATPase subunit
VSELVLEALSDGPLYRVDARFGPWTSAVLGSDPLSLATLVDVGAGVRAPGRGRVLLDGTPLHASPERRRGTATLLAVESVPGFRRVTDGVALVLEARGEQRKPGALLEEVGLGAWAARFARDLDASEARTLALALALSHPSPRLVALYEPFSAGRALGADFVRAGIARATAAGAVVLVATQSLDDARSLGASPFVLDRGTLASVPDVPLGAAQGTDQAFVVETTDARRLTAALAGDPAVRGVRFGEELAPGTVIVLGSDIEAVASAVTRALSEESLGVRSLRLAPLPLDAFVAAQWAASPSTFGYAPAPAPYAQPAPYGGSAPYGAGMPAGAVPPSSAAPAPPDQSVSMPTEFADPKRPFGGGT